MALRKQKSIGKGSSIGTITPDFPKKTTENSNQLEQKIMPSSYVRTDVDIDLREVYFLIMHFLSAGPCKRICGQFWNELLEHQLLPRRYHAWYSRSGASTGDEDDDGISLPLSYINLEERYPHVDKDHLVKILKQLIFSSSQPPGILGGGPLNAADVPTLLGSGSFSLLELDKSKEVKGLSKLPVYLRWPHMQADQVRGLTLREIGGGFTKHHRAPSIRAACYAIAKPSTLVQKMETIKKLRGHQNAVYCAIFDRSGQYVITGSDDRLVKIWSMETAFCLASCRGHEGDITDLAVNTNNTVVASSANDFVIRVWRLPDGCPISVLRGHTAAVTAIVFSPRLGAVYQLLSSSDDGSCRIWDARFSSYKPRVYIPKPSEVGKGNDPSPSAGQQTHQILCCAFNSSGTVFVTGSSDTYARVWNACKINTDDSEQYHEMDLLAGHENDVNYVQFSGCAVAFRSSTADTFKEDSLPKFKNSWFTHDNIVTCSRDGSAIIWIPRSRRSHGKVGRWTRAYHLKVPPPPMPPQPPRGGPRQRYQQTPRGVNMIVWSLDNRFVLAAIMDCRICVWNASDGSLVHSLTGHKESTFVLDVHPFNPRIAMSAGYDGKTIIWDIWEGKPVRIFEIGHFKLVDGKFSPDGTSIVLSDDVGQIYFVATGEGESQKDAKYDQFFLGDYRPLMQDTHGNALDQETQLTPYRRNIQDLLCDSSMIPYPEPYQSMYQRCRLGILGIEWRPTSLNLAVGPAYNVNTGDFQALPVLDLDQWIEPLPEVADAIEWEPENEMQSDDNSDSEFNVADECSSGGEQESLGDCSSSDTEVSGPTAPDSHDDNGLRRSKRKKHKSKAELITSFGRRVKRRNLDVRDGITITRDHKSKMSRNGCSIKRNKSSKSKSKNRSARNVRPFTSKISGASTDGEYEDELWESESESESGSEIFCSDSDGSMQSTYDKHSRKKEVSREESEYVKQLQTTDDQINSGNRKRLVLKLPIRHSAVPVSSSRNACLDNHNNADEMNSSSFANPDSAELRHNCKLEQVSKDTTDENGEIGIEEHFQPTLSAGCQANSIKWGEVKLRSSKRVKYSTDAWSAPKLPDVTRIVESSNNEPIKFRECGASSSSRIQDLQNSTDAFMQDNTGNFMPSPERNSRSLRHQQFPCVEQQAVNHVGNGALELVDRNHCHNFGSELRNTSSPVEECNMSSRATNIKADKDLETSKIGILKFQIKSKVLSNETNNGSAKLKSVAVEGLTTTEREILPNFPVATTNNLVSVVHGGDEGISCQNKDSCEVDCASSIEAWKPVSLLDSKKINLDSNDKLYSAVYKRSKSSRGRKCLVAEADVKEESTSNSNDNFEEVSTSRCRTRFMGMASAKDGSTPSDHHRGLRKSDGSLGTSPSRGKLKVDVNDQFLGDKWNPVSKVTVGLRSARNRRENYNSDLGFLNKRKHPQRLKKISWLMLCEHEEGYRYIPQKGDEIAYLRQGHEEFIDSSRLHDMGPWKSLKGSLGAVEICAVREIDYSTVAGSGESCCKLHLEFVDSSSDVFGKSFMITLPDLVSFPDFLVEKTRYDLSIERNWATRDKCQVWWKNENGDGGSWWEGRIMTVKSKSPDFPDSPWNKYEICYRVDPPERQWHSPWELYDTNSKWEHPHIDESKRDVVLESILKLEDKSSRNQDRYGIQRLNQAAEKSDYLNRFPVPLSLDVIKLRLENNYYRTTVAVAHDAAVMLSNAEAYFGKSAEMVMKMRRLSDWFANIFSSL